MKKTLFGIGIALVLVASLVLSGGALADTFGAYFSPPDYDNVGVTFHDGYYHKFAVGTGNYVSLAGNTSSATSAVIGARADNGIDFIGSAYYGSDNWAPCIRNGKRYISVAEDYISHGRIYAVRADGAVERSYYTGTGATGWELELISTEHFLAVSSNTDSITSFLASRADGGIEYFDGRGAFWTSSRLLNTSTVYVDLCEDWLSVDTVYGLQANGRIDWIHYDGGWTATQVVAAGSGYVAIGGNSNINVWGAPIGGVYGVCADGTVDWIHNSAWQTYAGAWSATKVLTGTNYGTICTDGGLNGALYGATPVTYNIKGANFSPADLENVGNILHTGTWHEFGAGTGSYVSLAGNTQDYSSPSVPSEGAMVGARADGNGLDYLGGSAGSGIPYVRNGKGYTSVAEDYSGTVRFAGEGVPGRVYAIRSDGTIERSYRSSEGAWGMEPISLGHFLAVSSLTDSYTGVYAAGTGADVYWFDGRAATTTGWISWPLSSWDQAGRAHPSLSTITYIDLCEDWVSLGTLYGLQANGEVDYIHYIDGEGWGGDPIAPAGSGYVAIGGNSNINVWGAPIGGCYGVLADGTVDWINNSDWNHYTGTWRAYKALNTSTHFGTICGDGGLNGILYGAPPATFIPPPPPPAPNLSDDKQKLDGASTEYTGIVTAGFDGYFYVEAADRSCGIRVQKAGYVAYVGTNVTVHGSMATLSSGERYIAADGTVAATNASELAPVFMNIKALGGGDLGNPGIGQGQIGVTGGAGLNNIGLLVKTFGLVTGTNGIDTINLDDGSGVPMSVYDPYGLIIYAVGVNDRVEVTGISQCVKNGANTERALLLLDYLVP